METLRLTTWERLQLLGLVSQQKCDAEKPLTHLRGLFRIIDVLEMNEEDRAIVGWRENEGGISWDLADHEFEMPFEDADFQELSRIALTFRGWPVLRPVLNLLEKLEALAT